MKQYSHLYDTKLIRSANSIYDLEFAKHLKYSGFIDKLFSNPDEQIVQEEYLNFYPKWLKTTKNNSFVGLDSFRHIYVSLGVTQLLDYITAYCNEYNYRLRIFKGEYPYIRDSYNFTQEQFVENNKLEKGDLLLISHPFSGTGSEHYQFQETVLLCEKLQIPIIIDSAFFGTCFDINFNFLSDAIIAVAFSLTKGLSCGNYRSGIVLSKKIFKNFDTQKKWRHGIHINTAIGLELMRNFTPDFLYNKYYATYINIVENLNLSKTNCIHLALGDANWNYFNRDKTYNRVGVSQLIKEVYNGANLGELLNV